MTTDDRAKAVAPFGFTPRQARFLALVMRHAGVCLLRQYATFAGIVQGQKTRAFFHKLVGHRHAISYACRHNRAKLYHVHHFALYRAIDEPNSAYRRPIPANRVAERLMMLDGVLTDPGLDWLASRAEKAAYFTNGRCSVPPEMLPRLNAAAAPRTDHAFPDKFPIGIATDGRPVFLYVVLPTVRDNFRAFLRRHATLFQTLPSWTLRVVLPRALADAYEGVQAVVRDEFESPLYPHTVDELKWYFEQRRRIGSTQFHPSDERFIRAADAFDAPRFDSLYQRWVRDGDSALEDVSSTAISDALTAGTGAVEFLVLPHRYDHLSPLVDSLNSRACGAEKGAENSHEQGDEWPTPSRPLLHWSPADPTCPQPA